MSDDYEDARDITHTAFLKAFERLRTFNSSHRFYSWLYRIAINESLNHLNKRRKTEICDERMESAGRSPEDAAHGAEVSGLVQRALMNLKTDHRAVIILRHFLDCSYEEIGTVLEIPSKTVKSRLFTARQHLKEAMIRRGVLKP
jgi:RNA polymerase sigma-70 factor (ECF subfamily)